MDIPKGGIAFFDSGIGGLTVLAECKKYIDAPYFYYFGDNARAPYGNLREGEILRYVFEAFEVFRNLEVRAAVVACNTATAVCIERLRKRYDFPVVGAEPAVFSAARTVKGEVFVLTTRATYRSERFRRLCQRARAEYPLARLRLYACEELAGEIETHGGRTDFDYTAFLPKGAPTAVVLGCTHYVYIRKQVENYYDCPCLDGNGGIAMRLRSIYVESEKKGGQNWERKPLVENCREKENCMTTDNPFCLKESNTNKCSWLFLPNAGEKEGGIFFLGSGKTQNKSIYEQTFGKENEMVVINPKKK